MTTTAKLIERLRNAYLRQSFVYNKAENEQADMCAEAADRLAELEAEVGRLNSEAGTLGDILKGEYKRHEAAEARAERYREALEKVEAECDKEYAQCFGDRERMESFWNNVDGYVFAALQEPDEPHNQTEA